MGRVLAEWPVTPVTPVLGWTRSVRARDTAASYCIAGIFTGETIIKAFKQLKILIKRIIVTIQIILSLRIDIIYDS